VRREGHPIDDVAAASHVHAWLQQIDDGIGDDE
jgi:hypothetical protein